MLLIPLILYVLFISYSSYLYYYDNSNPIINLKNDIYSCDKFVQNLIYVMLKNNCEYNYKFEYGKRFIVNEKILYSLSELDEIDKQCHKTFDSIIIHMINNRCYNTIKIR